MDKLFSERNGLVTHKMQIESMNEELRTRLWNAFYVFLMNPHKRIIAIFLWTKFFKWKIDEYSHKTSGNLIKKEFFDMPWYRVYDLIEVIYKFDAAGSVMGLKRDKF